MLEVACAVCGAVYRFPRIDIPVGGKTVACAKCKARIVVQPPPPPPPMIGGTGDVIDLGRDQDLIDMPREGQEVVDLPAPKLLPSVGPDREIVDLPAPRLLPRTQTEPLTLDNIDLLAPVGPTRSRPPAPPPLIPPPAAPPLIPPPPSEAQTIPRPRGAAGAIPDLPAPKRSSEPVRPSFTVPAIAPPTFGVPPPPTPAPAPAPTSAARGTDPADLPDLPAPKYGGPARDLFDDLPSRGPSLADLPTPKRASTPAAAPQPAPAAAPPADITDLPAPKGFFEDLPRPAANQDPRGSSDLPAPKGFFDDLPQPAGPGRPDLPAPKGFFDDLPQAATQARSDLPAPKGFFDDLPQPGHSATGVELPSPREFFDEASQHSRGPRPEHDLGGHHGLPDPVATGAPPLDLGEDGLSGLDLPDAPPMIPATRTGVVSFSNSAPGEQPRNPAKAGGLNELDLAAPARRDSPSQPIQVRADAAPRISRRKLKKVAAIAAIALALGGTGGYLMYDRWQTKKARAAAIEHSLADAHRALLAGDPSHWGKALGAAKDVLARSPKHPEALATAALAQLAGYYDQGTNRDGRVKAGRALLEQARLASARGPTMTKALAIDTLIEGDGKAAITRLTPLAASDPEALLYLGWAQLAAERWDEAGATFDKTIAKTPGRKLVATYGKAQALLGKGDVEAARAAFLAVIALDANHVGAQVGLAAAMPAADFLKQETELLAILQRPKLDTVDPRVRAQAWRLAGNDARSAGRLDAARERYRKALELVTDDVATLIAGAALELRDGKLDVAATDIERALTRAPDDVDANLVKIELDITNLQLNAAEARLKTLRDRQPPIVNLVQRGQIEILDGHRLATGHDINGAIASYRKARDILGTDNIAPTIAASTLLGRLAAEADKAGKTDQATKLRAQATAELAVLSDAATADPTLAVTLGVAYADAGGLVDAERWLRGAVAARPGDVEARFQLAEVLRKAGKTDEAIESLKEAFALAPSRVDLGVGLARAYEAAGRDVEAGDVYETMLKGDDIPDLAEKISIDVRARAGRYFARIDKKDRAGAQGAAILKVEPDSATGHFLAGEGLLHAGKAVDARQEMQRAFDRDPDPQFADGLGRAQEQIFKEANDTAARDEALRAYLAASAKAPAMLHPLAAAGRLYLHRREFGKAIDTLKQAYALSATAEIAGDIGMSYFELKDRREALHWLEIARKGAPPAETIYVLARLYGDLNRGADQAAMLTRATDEGEKAEPKPSKFDWLDDAYLQLAELQDARNNLTAACRAYANYISRGPSDPGKLNVARSAYNLLKPHC